MNPTSSSDSGEASDQPSRWRLAQDGTTATSVNALHELAESYWYCVYAWWRRAGLDPTRGSTATLASFERWLRDAPPKAADSGSARLRDWLPARLAELASSGVKLTGAPPIPIKPAWAEARYADEPPGEADAIFQRRWALTVLEFTVNALKAEYSARGEEKLFDELLPFAGFEMTDDERYEAAAARTGRTSGGMRKAVFDFRTRQRELLREFVADTVADPAEIEGEITALLIGCDAAGPQSATAPLPTILQSVQPDQVLARAMNSVKMSSGGAHGWSTPTVAEASRLFPNYEVVTLLGRGGMGAVYQARQIALDRLVAIKLLPLEISVDRDFADRFRREARTMAKLNHPHIISVHDFGQTSEGHLFFAMEFVEGANLHDIIHQSELAPDQALSIAAQVCTALAYAHGKGVVHRDVKPANVMIDTESQVKVADFGLARLTEPGAEHFGHTTTGTVMGTPDYMAPEQKRAMNVDHRADIYSLGVMLYEMLCREIPQGAFDLPSQRIGCDRRLDAIVLKAMQQSPDRRYQSTQEMKADVESARAPLPVAAPPQAATAPPPKPPRPPKARAAVKPAKPLASVPQPARKSRAPLWIALAATLAVLAGAVALFSKHLPKGADGGVSHAATTTTGGAIAAATKDAPFVNTLGMKFVPVPITGGPTGGQRGSPEGIGLPLVAGAATSVLFSVWDTRVQDYGAYAGAKKVDDSWTKQARDGVPVGREMNHPVVGVSWEDAQAFCQWLTEKEIAEGKLPKGMKYRLPTDEEWSRAVGLPPEPGSTPAGKSRNNSVDFPWGKDYPPKAKVGNYADEAFHAEFPPTKNSKGNGMLWIEGYTDGYATTSPVGSFPANTYGLCDMGGNVWQWCEDWSDASHKQRVLRGASWYNYDRSDLLSSNRNHNVPGDRRPDSGFRSVLAPASASSSVPPAPTPTVSVAPGAPASGKRIDLLPLVDIKRDAIKGVWIAKPEGLALGVPADFGVLELPYEPPEEYDFEVAFTPTEGGLNPNLYLRAGGSSFTWKTNAYNHAMGFYGFDMLDGKLMWANPEAYGTNPLRIENGQRYITRVEVRVGGLRGLVNGIEMMKWSGDFKRLSMEAGCKLRNERAIGVGSYQRGVTFHGIDIYEISGTGRITTGAALTSAVSIAIATKDKPFVNMLGMKFVPVPIQGGPTDGQRVLVSAWDTRVQDYEAFVKETRREWPPSDFPQGPTHPAVNVSWEDAQLFCQWLTARDRAAGLLPADWRYRLPSDHEWSCAVDLGTREDAAKLPVEKNGKITDAFPWGAQWPPRKGAGNYAGEELRPALAAGKYSYIRDVIPGYNDGFVNTSPVGSFPPNRFGLLDMGGNVWQWCEDWYTADLKERVIRGASWANNDRSVLLASNRNHNTPGIRTIYHGLGFRCVVARGAGGRAAPAAASFKAGIPPDAERFGGHRYKRIATVMDFDEAKAAAEAVGGHLATLTSAAEYEWALKTFMHSGTFAVWLGAYRDGNGAWKWVTGEPWNYTAWESYPDGKREPSDTGTHVQLRSDPPGWKVTENPKPYFLVEWDEEGGPPSSLPAANAPPAGWIPLLPLIDPRRDAVDGEWKLVSGELQGNGNFARLALPYTPPEEYDFRIRFTRPGGSLAVSQHLAGARQDIMWLMGGFGNTAWGLEQVGGAKGNANITTVKSGLENGRRYESLVKVRRNRVQVEVDGKQVVDYPTDWSDLSMNSKWAFPDPKKLGVGCQQATVFHGIEVREITGQGRVTR